MPSLVPRLRSWGVRVLLIVACEGHIRLADALAGPGRKEEASHHYQEAITMNAADNLTEEARRKLLAIRKSDHHEGPEE